MNRWLYLNDGYYTKVREIGKSGDFYTSVSVSSFFGGTIAKHLISLIENGFLDKNSLILEIGSHKGYLLADMIQFIYTLSPNLLDSLRFGILEPLKSLRELQKSYFQESFNDSIKLYQFSNLDEILEDSIFVVANELFDAFICDVVFEDKMLFVDSNQNLIFGPMNDNIKSACLKYKIKKGEIAIGYEEFAKKLFKIAKKIEFVTFDYGEKEPRGEFSIRVYKNHRVYNLFELDGKLAEFFKNSDITYDVSFLHLMSAFSEAGFEIVEFNYQANALINFGIIELLEMLKKHSSYKNYLREVNRVKTLIHPSFMGERFKMLRIKKEGEK